MRARCRFAALAVASVVAVLAACSSSDDGSSAIESTPTPATIVTEAETGTDTVADTETGALAGTSVITMPGPIDATSIAVAGDGDVWVGTAKQVWHLVDDESVQYDLLGVIDLEIAPDGVVWAAAYSPAALQKGEWVRYTSSTGPFNDLTVGADGTVWACDRFGVHRLNGDVWELVDEAIPLTIGANSFSCKVEAGSDGTVWVGAWVGFGPSVGFLTRFDGSSWQEIRLPAGRSPGVYAMALAPNGDLWTVFIDDGPDNRFVSTLGRFDGETWTVFDEAAGMPPIVVDSLAIDQEGVVWLIHFTDVDDSTDIGGLIAFDGEDWTSLLDGHTASDVAVSPDGTVWVAGDQLFSIER